VEVLQLLYDTEQCFAVGASVQGFMSACAWEFRNGMRYAGVSGLGPHLC
jgi:hypothetical protein